VGLVLVATQGGSGGASLTATVSVDLSLKE
jgi:hypothetical protein